MTLQMAFDRSLQGVVGFTSAVIWWQGVSNLLSCQCVVVRQEIMLLHVGLPSCANLIIMPVQIFLQILLGSH